MKLSPSIGIKLNNANILMLKYRIMERNHKYKSKIIKILMKMDTMMKLKIMFKDN